MRLLVLALVVGSGLLQLVCAQQAFLQAQLPLKVLVTTPSELASDGAAQPVMLTGRQAITVGGQATSPAYETGSSGCKSLAERGTGILAAEEQQRLGSGSSSSCPVLATSSLEPSAGVHAAHTQAPAADYASLVLLCCRRSSLGLSLHLGQTGAARSCKRTW